MSRACNSPCSLTRTPTELQHEETSKAGESRPPRQSRHSALMRHPRHPAGRMCGAIIFVNLEELTIHASGRSASASIFSASIGLPWGSFIGSASLGTTEPNDPRSNSPKAQSRSSTSCRSPVRWIATADFDRTKTPRRDRPRRQNRHPQNPPSRPSNGRLSPRKHSIEIGQNPRHRGVQTRHLDPHG